MVFTVLTLQILYWIYEIDIHSYVFILGLPTNIYLLNKYYLFLAGNWVVSIVCLTVEENTGMP
jgi:hypothetical protein